jgi:excisionase family DNA binding protein
MILDEGAMEALVERAARRAVREELAKVASDQQEYVSVAVAAARVEVTPATIREWVRRGRLRRYQAGRELRVKVTELAAMMTAGRVPVRVEIEDGAFSRVLSTPGTTPGRTGGMRPWRNVPGTCASLDVTTSRSAS